MTIQDMNDGQMLDKFFAGLKPQAGTGNVDYGPKIALKVDTGLFGSGMVSLGVEIFLPTAYGYCKLAR